MNLQFEGEDESYLLGLSQWQNDDATFDSVSSFSRTAFF